MVKVLEKLKYIENGGIEKFVFDSVSRLDSHTAEAEIYYENKPSTDKYIDFDEKHNIKLICPAQNYASIRFKPFRVLAKWNGFLRYAKENHYDIIHIHLCRPYDGLYAMAAQIAGCKNIILHSHFSERSDCKFFEKILDPIFRTVNRITGSKFAACSESAARYMFGKTDFILLKNGIDTSAFSYSVGIRTAERERMKLSDSFVIGNVGRLCELKNQTFLLEIFSEIVKIHSNSILVIAGDGELSDSLREKAKALDISEKVVFCGSVDNVSALYQAFDCFVFPSLSEGLGIAAVEAQTSGLITVCSDGVPKEAAITELCSFMPLSAFPKEWAEHIISVCNGYERRSYAEEIKAAGYDINDTAKQLEKIYRSLLDG